jgi:quercetin dioxygenase-like cupin family protein
MMKRLPFSSLVFFFLVSIVLFSGQQRQRATPRPAVPPKPAAVTPAEKTAEAEMPPIFYLSGDIKFPENAADSPRTATLLGDPKSEGLYVTRTIIPKGKKIIPHTHSDSRTVVVLSGVYYYGLGEEFDEKRMVSLPPGSFFTEPAGVPHFTWAKDTDVMVQTTALGPSGTKIIPDKKPKDAAISQP